MNGQSQGRHLIIARTDSEGAVTFVGFLVDLDLVVEKLFGQLFGLGGSRQVKPGGLEEHLEPADEVGLADLEFDHFLASRPILTVVTDLCGFFLSLSFATNLLSKLVS